MYFLFYGHGLEEYYCDVSSRTRRSSYRKIMRRRPILLSKNRLESIKYEKGRRSTRTWNRFANSTSIHGVRQVNAKYIYWYLIFLSMLGLTIWSTTDNVLDYLKYNIETSTTSKQFNQTQFPSITFCERNPLIKTSSINNDDYFTLAAMYYSQTKSMTEMTEIFRMLKQECSTSSKTSSDNETVEYLIKTNFNDFYRKHALNSFTSVIKCWWMNENVACDGLFFNRLLDTGPCFTFNPLTEWLKEGLQNIGYGFNVSAEDKVVKTYGPNTGIRLILFTGGKDNCGFRYWRGAGYQVKIHDPADASPMFYLGKSILFEPGYEFSIQIMPTVNERKTAQLGKCLDAGYYLSANGEGYYNQPVCFLICFLEDVLQSCECKPWFILGLENRLSSRLGYTLNHVNVCESAAELSCVKDQSLLSILSDVSQEKSCPQCLPACQEITYDYIVTRKRFPPNKHFATKLLRWMNSTVDVENFRKHYLSVNFFIDKLRLEEVKQFQQKTKIDVFINFGGVIGLFLGMSFISIFEVVDIFAELCEILFCKTIRKKLSALNQRVRNYENFKHNKIRPLKVKRQNVVTVEAACHYDL